ncbi:unnamed protein product [Pedinophyceae sp. YPF-701]|nr:unnamed protein product [Pedinophyceae sp. YPF-701]
MATLLRLTTSTVARNATTKCLSRKAASAHAAFARNVLASPLQSNTRGSRSLRSSVVAMGVKIASLPAPFLPEKFPAVTVEAPYDGSWKGDLLCLGVYDDAIDGTTIKDEALSKLDQTFGGALSEIIADFEFKGAAGSSQCVRVGTAGAKYVALVGLGSASKAAEKCKWGPSVFMQLGAAIAGLAKSNKAVTAAVHIVGGSASATDVARGVTLGVLNGAYESTRFKAKPTLSKLESLAVCVGKSAEADAAVANSTAFAKGCTMAKFLVEAPPNVCTPTYLSHCAQELAKEYPDVMTCKILEREDCEKMEMGSYLGVAACSDEPPKFIHLSYNPPGGSAKKTLVLIGKGLTFDSGGYNLKPAGSMIELMKFDMGGSAAVLGAARTLADLKPANVAVHFIVASCENMIDGAGMRPGDILRAANGKTIEVNNTDAEGRLTLADALIYAERECKPDAVVDIATLTGAQFVALGNGMAAFYTKDDGMADDIRESATHTGEKIWQMPLEDSYMEQLKSVVADMKNTGGRWGGSITAALFLQEFISTDKIQWAHIDMAGPAWDEKVGGATGYGAKTLAQWVMTTSEKA